MWKILNNESALNNHLKIVYLVKMKSFCQDCNKSFKSRTYGLFYGHRKYAHGNLFAFVFTYLI
jgi:hypothetical protein